MWPYLHKPTICCIVVEWNLADYTLWNMEWNMEWDMEWKIGYQTSVMSQDLHLYHKAVTVLDLYHFHLNLYTKSAFA